VITADRQSCTNYRNTTGTHVCRATIAVQTLTRSHAGITHITNSQTLMSLPEQYDGKSGVYRAWKDKRLRLADQLPDGKVPTVALTPNLDSSSDDDALAQLCINVRDHGFGVYHHGRPTENVADEIEQLHRQLSLTVHDSGVVSDRGGLSLLKDLSSQSSDDSGNTGRGKFIPYTSKAMGWHTDGYYNDQSQTLRCFTLHCISPAATGGTLSVMDYELLLIALYDEDRDLIELLCHPEAMTLPANKDNLGHDRPDRHVPVFFIHPDGTAEQKLRAPHSVRARFCRNIRTGITTCDSKLDKALLQETYSTSVKRL